MDMTILVVTEEQELALLSFTKARERLEESRAIAVAANEAMFEALINNDPEEGSVDEQANAADKNYKSEAAADRAWARYEKALIRYGWELALAKKLGVIL